jgi:CheY-like chemotaxis protein
MLLAARTRMTRVLVVDDSEDLQDALEMVLTDAGFEVVRALSGAEGLERVRELHPDVVLLDMMMPEMDGLEFLSHLSTLPAPPPVVATSGFAGFRAEATRRGATAFLVKPASIEVLLSAIHSSLERRARR